jgi:hypothetical protein
MAETLFSVAKWKKSDESCFLINAENSAQSKSRTHAAPAVHVSNQRL